VGVSVRRLSQGTPGPVSAASSVRDRAPVLKKLKHSLAAHGRRDVDGVAFPGDDAGDKGIQRRQPGRQTRIVREWYRPQHLQERSGERSVRGRRRGWHGPAGHGPDVVFRCPAGHLSRQTGLADPRLAGQPHAGAVAAGGGRQATPERLQLRIAADDHRTKLQRHPSILPSSTAGDTGRPWSSHRHRRFRVPPVLGLVLKALSAAFGAWTSRARAISGACAPEAST
jgi:hypothetical protein